MKPVQVNAEDISTALDSLEEIAKSSKKMDGAEEEKKEEAKEEAKEEFGKECKKVKKSEAEEEKKEEAKEEIEGAPVSKKAKKMAKSEPSEGDMGEDEDGMSKDENPDAESMAKKYGNAKEAKKSEGFADEMNKSETVQKSLEVSEFLKELVDQTASAIDAQSQIIKSLTETQAADTEKLDLIVKSQAAIGVVLKSMIQRLGIIENAPARAPKSAISKSDVSERFEKSAGDQLTKSQVLDTLMDMVRKGEAADTDVIRYEQENFLRPEVARKVEARFSN